MAEKKSKIRKKPSAIKIAKKKIIFRSDGSARRLSIAPAMVSNRYLR